MYSILEDLFQFNSWANKRIFSLCEGLTDEQLDERRELGFGSLRNTIFHILAAEEIWFERWNGEPWRAFQTDAGGLPLSDIAARLDEVGRKRQALLDRERATDWNRVCNYKDAKGNSYLNPLNELALHVANHGIHHRAQALSYLKHFGRTVPGGLDYIFYRLAKPLVEQDASTASALKQYGLEVATGISRSFAWDSRVIQNYFAYGDWANDRALDLVDGLDDSALDRSWNLGMDTIRKTAMHVLDAERWWLRNWTEGPSQFEKLPESTSVGQIRELWSQVISARNSFVAKLDPDGAQRVVTAIAGGPPIKFTILESMLQLGGHGTHHRAQLINMLRHSQTTAPSLPGFDYIVWVREKRV